MKDKKLLFGIPKGSLQENSLLFLRKAGFDIYITPRVCQPKIDDPEMDCFLLRAQEIPKYVSLGKLDVGIAGSDWICEQKAKIVEVKERAGQINLKDMMKKLAQMQVTNILVEGGGTLIGSLFDEQIVDRILFFISPKIIGGKDAISSVMGKGVARIEHAIKLKDIKLKRIGEDFLAEAYV